ncbi:ornithine cyclodeaminase family protein [Verticiella sediminum]|nr:ornithine cyclodeaminase family protein [Verticiella sediminum]
MTTALWLSEADVAGSVSLAEAIEALQERTAQVAAGQGANIEKALGTFDARSSLHALGAVLPAAGFGGYKTWVNTPDGAKALYALFDTRAGRLLAMLEANVLGQLRTSAMTGLGTRWLAAEDAGDLALLGSGRQALAQVAAIHAVRPLRRVRVWSPSAERREACTRDLVERLGLDVQACDSIEAATAAADIVTVVTRARTPFLQAGMIADGAHVNAVGAILPANAELHADVLDRAGIVAVDDVANVRKSSREFIDRFGTDEGPQGWGRVATIGDIVRGAVTPTRAPGSISLFKAVGMGVSDLAMAIRAYQACRETGAGLPLPLTQGARMRFS